MDLLASLGINIAVEVERRSTYASLIELDEKLARTGIHSISPWWRSQCERFYKNDTTLRWPARVGRGGAKSTAIVKVGLNETLNSTWNVPPGEMHYFAIVSENKDEAHNRLILLDDCLTKLGITHKWSGSRISIPSLRLGFRVLAKRIGAVSGFRAIGYAADEVAKWSEEGVDPSDEIITSLEAMTVTHSRARGLIFSSPMGKIGLHYERVEAGDTENQIVSVAPSWVANPGITESQTRRLEPSERKWLREYAAIPQGDATGVFDMDAVERCMQLHEQLQIEAQASPLMIMDASRGGDAWVYAPMRWVWWKGKARMWVKCMNEVETPPKDVEFTEHAIATVTKASKAHSCNTICADQYQAPTLKMLFGAHGLTYWEHTWTAPTKREAVDLLESWLRDEILLIPNLAILKRQLSEYKERISRTNEITYGGTGPTDDYVQTLMTGAMAHLANRFEAVVMPVTQVVHGSAEYWAEKERSLERQLEEKLERARREDREIYG